MLFGFVMKKLFAVVVLMMLVWHHAFSLDLNITLSNAGDLINQVDVSKLDEVESLTITGDLNGTDILVIRKMVNLQTLDMTNANIVNGGQSYYENYTTSENAIGEYFFKDNKSMKHFKMPRSISQIKKGAFWGCTQLQELIITNNVKTIEGGNVFDGCSGLNSVIIEDGNGGIFIGASFIDSPLETVYMGRGVKYNDHNSPFLGNATLQKITFNDKINVIELSEFRNCLGITSITLPKELKRIEDSAFEGCVNLKEIVIGSDLATIKKNAFYRCESLEKISISDLKKWCGILFGWVRYNVYHNDTVYSEFANPLYYANHLYINGKEIEELVIPEDVKKIMPYAFINGKGFSSITVSDTVEEIGELAFHGCVKATSIKLGKELKQIGVCAFTNCNALEAIEIPDNVIEIDKGAFLGCVGMKKIYLGRKLISIGDNAFRDCRSLRNVISLNTTPPKITEITFDESTEKNATLNVPIGCKNIYWLHPYWENFMKIEEIEVKEDFSEKQVLALKSYQDGMSIYDSYVYYYKGDGQKFYQTTIGKQGDNNKVADDIFTDIERLRKQLSDSSISDDEKASYYKTLDEIDNAVYALKKENESGYYINFNYRVEKNYIPFSDYYSRLEQYKERIDAATTNDELDAIIAEIDADAAGMKDYYLNPIIDDYNEMVRISQRFTEIGEELSKYQTKLKEITKDIETTISGIEPILMSEGDVIVVNLRGERMTVKSSQIKALPKGIYTLNGRKFVVN